MKSDKSKPVALEDLLRLKRAERPPAEFWPQFERELRAKQLSALVVRRPWWRTLPSRALVGFSRYHLPLGATAVLALTFLSVREYQTASPGRILTPGLGEIPADIVSSANNSTSPMSISTAPQAVTVAGSVGFNTSEDISPSETAEAASSTVAGVDRVSAMAALIGGSSELQADPSPSARSIAENFAAAQSADNNFGSNRSLVVSTSRGFESRALPAPARMPIMEPLAQMTPPSDVRRARYLGTALPAVASAKQVAPRSSERPSSRIADERLYESLSSRLGVGGDRIMVKF